MDYLEELNKIKTWIKNLIIIQYRQSRKNRALIDILVELFFANNLIPQIRDLCLSVDKSEGAQLDVVGKWVGVDRFYNGIELWEHRYLSFINYSDMKDPIFPNNLDWTQGGFSSYSTFADNDGGFLMYKQWQDTRTAVNKLGDDIFRQLIKLKIIKNSINHTQKNIDDAIWSWAGGNKYYSLSALSVNDYLYLDKNFNKIYGKITAISANNITVVDENNNEIYKGYFNYNTTTETINGIENTTVYNYYLGHVYTTWDVMKVIYNYDSDYKNIMTIASYKDILPSPTGCEIVTQQIV